MRAGRRLPGHRDRLLHPNARNPHPTLPCASSTKIIKLTSPMQKDKHQECHGPRWPQANPRHPRRHGPRRRAGRMHRGHQRVQYPAGAVPRQPAREPSGRRRRGQRHHGGRGPGGRGAAAAGPGQGGFLAQWPAEDGAVGGGGQR